MDPDTCRMYRDCYSECTQIDSIMISIHFKEAILIGESYRNVRLITGNTLSATCEEQDANVDDAFSDDGQPIEPRHLLKR